MATPPTTCAAHSGTHQIHERHLSWTESPSTLRRAALSSLGALGTAFVVSDAAPLPPDLLSTARLHAMSEAELWALPPLDVSSDVPPASAASEWRALTKLRRALCPGSAADLSPSLPAEEVAQLLRALCAVEVEPMPLRRHSSDANARTLLAALGGGGGERVAVVGCSAGGRGLVAASPIASDEVVVSLPAASLVSGATARAELPAAVVAALEEEGEWSDHLLVMHLLMRERERGAASPLAAWLGLLPRLDGAGVPPSAWSDDELEALGGTDAYWTAHAARGELAELRQTLMPRLAPALSAAAAAAPGGEGGGSGFVERAYSEERWTWAKALLDTRAISLPAPAGAGLPGGALVLAPFLDLCNHRCAPNLELAVEGSGGGARLCLRAVAPVGEGEQLCISYGRFDAQAMLLHYGMDPGCCAAPLLLRLSLPPCEALDAEPSLLGLRSCPSSTLPSKG